MGAIRLPKILVLILGRGREMPRREMPIVHSGETCRRLLARLAPFASVLGSWGKTMREAVRNKERCQGRRTPTRDPSTHNQCAAVFDRLFAARALNATVQFRVTLSRSAVGALKSSLLVTPGGKGPGIRPK